MTASSETITAAEYNALAHRQKRSKYGNVSTECDGYVFDSIAEMRHYRDELKLRELAGDICDLQLQPRLDLVVNGVRIGAYVGDFAFTETATGRYVVQDVKSAATKTATYRMKAKLVKALYGIEIEEVMR